MHLRIELIDSSTRRPIKCWRFAELVEVTLGRAPERDIDVTDPYVSRHHASLQFRENVWHLVAFGRNGVLMAGNSVEDVPIIAGQEFRLGALGPEFRFGLEAESMAEFDENQVGTETFQFSGDLLPEFLVSPEDVKFELDQQCLEREVNEVVESDYFQRLQDLSKRLRDQRRTSGT